MLFARWQHHLRFCSRFPYAPLKAMVTKISKWSRIQDSFQITPKIESLVVCVIPDIPSIFQKDPSITFWVILLTHRQTNRHTKSGKNITSLAEVTIEKYVGPEPLPSTCTLHCATLTPDLWSLTFRAENWHTGFHPSGFSSKHFCFQVMSPYGQRIGQTGKIRNAA